MASIRQRYDMLIVDFRYQNVRCREKTNLTDTPANRKKLATIIEKMQAEILLGTFDYGTYFPKSDKVAYFNEIKAKQENLKQSHVQGVPLFADFVALWLHEKQIEWRVSYQQKIQIILDKYLMPVFGQECLSLIKRQDVLAFRASLGKEMKSKHTLSAARINQIMATLSMILKEASKRYHFDDPSADIKQLKVDKSEIVPFSLDEVWRFLDGVRADYKNYYLVRFFTGMRTSEIDGLTWDCVDFDRREIHIRQALVNGVLGKPKTTESARQIIMSPFVYDALKAQHRIYQANKKQGKFKQCQHDFVFCLQNGEPLDYRNVNRRIWHPTLKRLGLKSRNAYQTRHTAATLWLAAGEAPEWIARQMGHVNTLMLFKVYSRYVPNATRQDGSAFEALLIKSQANQQTHQKQTEQNNQDL